MYAIICYLFCFRTGAFSHFPLSSLTEFCTLFGYSAVQLVPSGVTKGPADPAVRGGAILGGRQIVVCIWDNFENLTKVLAKLRILL